MDKEITLAIETCVGGGSLTLFENDSVIDSIIGSTEISRAEDLLEEISNLLSKNKIKKTDLDIIAVSLGPGSYTGGRIGLATAKGLKSGLNIRLRGTTTLEALTVLAPADGCVITCVSSGKNEVFFEMFEKKTDEKLKVLNAPKILTIDELLTTTAAYEIKCCLVFEHKLFTRIQEHLNNFENICIKADENLSKYVGEFCIKNNESDNAELLYLHR